MTSVSKSESDEDIRDTMETEVVLVNNREDQMDETKAILVFAFGLVCLSGSLFYTKTMLMFESTNPLQALYVSTLLSFMLGMVC